MYPHDQTVCLAASYNVVQYNIFFQYDVGYCIFLVWIRDKCGIEIRECQEPPVEPAGCVADIGLIVNILKLSDTLRIFSDDTPIYLSLEDKEPIRLGSEPEEDEW